MFLYVQTCNYVVSITFNIAYFTVVNPSSIYKHFNTLKKNALWNIVGKGEII